MLSMPFFRQMEQFGQAVKVVPDVVESFKADLAIFNGVLTIVEFIFSPKIFCYFQMFRKTFILIIIIIRRRQ